MKSMMKILGIAALAATAFSFNFQQDDPWKVPEKYNKLKNPVAMDASSIKSGKDLYITYCTSCHGLNGQGTGKRAEKLNMQPTDFTAVSFQAQTDGSLLYKIYFGHKEMPGFKNRLPGRESINENSFGNTRVAGDLINFIRSYSKK